MDTVEFAVMDARKGAELRPVGTYHGTWRMMRTAFPLGSEWYMVHGFDDTSEYEVMRAVDGGFEPIAQTSDPLFVAAVYSAAQYESHAGGARVRAMSCADDRCETGIVDFDTGSIQRLGDVTVAGTTLGAERIRWLSCNTADAILVDVPDVKAGEFPTFRYYAGRITANGGE